METTRGDFPVAMAASCRATSMWRATFRVAARESGEKQGSGGSDYSFVAPHARLMLQVEGQGSNGCSAHEDGQRCSKRKWMLPRSAVFARRGGVVLPSSTSNQDAVQMNTKGLERSTRGQRRRDSRVDRGGFKRSKRNTDTAAIERHFMAPLVFARQLGRNPVNRLTLSPLLELIN
jgi:hypothetical protein